jgi:hypothetical protein
LLPVAVAWSNGIALVFSAALPLSSVKVYATSSPVRAWPSDHFALSRTVMSADL